MSKEKSNICPKCGKKCKPRGLGPHMRLAHGIVVKDVIRHISDSSEVVREKRPSDYLKKKEKTAEVKIVEAPPQTVPEPDKSLVDKLRCQNCGKYYPRDEFQFSAGPLPGLCLSCHEMDQKLRARGWPDYPGQSVIEDK